MELILAPESWPFSVAVMLLVAITVIEGMGLLFGLSVSGWFDNLLPETLGDGMGGVADSWLGWLHLGKVPVLVLLVLLLMAFSIIGYTVNAVTHALLGFYPPALLSGIVALLGALPVVRIFGGFLARVIPRDETSAVLLEILVGRIAVIINGTARSNYPAEAKVKNEQGQTFYVRVEPDAPDVQFGAGEAVLLVRQISGSRFMAIANPRPDLL